VTAETAVVLPVLVAVLAAGLWVVGAATAQLRCLDAASVAARAAARGESDAAVASLADVAAPAGSSIAIQRSATTVTVTVRTEVRPLHGAGLRLPGLGVSGSAVAADEAVLPPPPP
jgi:hypothetical protein